MPGEPGKELLVESPLEADGERVDEGRFPGGGPVLIGVQHNSVGPLGEGTELARIEVDGVIGHAEVRIGDSVVMMFDAAKEWPETPGFLRLYVEDCEATYRQALAAGATSVTEPTYPVLRRPGRQGA